MTMVTTTVSIKALRLMVVPTVALTDTQWAVTYQTALEKS